MGSLDGWLAVLAIGLATMVIKSAGPVVLGGRPMPSRLAGVVALLAPALLMALVATATFARGQALVLDARAIGVGAAAVAVAARAPMLLVVVLAAVVTALARLAGLH